MVGRPGCWWPVAKKVTAGSWLIGSVKMERTKVQSSTTLARLRQELGEVHAGLAMLGEFEGRADAEEVLLAAGHAGDALAFADAVGQVLAGHFGELRLGIEEVEVRGRAGHEEVDDPLRLGREMEALERAGDGGAGAGFEAEGARAEQGAKGDGAEAGAAFLQEGAAG